MQINFNETKRFYRVQDWALRGQHLKGKQGNILFSKKLIKIVYLFSGAIYNILKNLLTEEINKYLKLKFLISLLTQ
jgi:hypothetical protein